MCAATRGEETERADSLFKDMLGYRLAGSEGRAAPMGSWIMVPRTRYGDDLLTTKYHSNGCRQLVLLGAGMDARAFRMESLSELRVFEVDQQTTFDVKEPLLRDEQVVVADRMTVSTEFTEPGRWAKDLEMRGFDKTVPTVWLLEGLLMYLSLADTRELMQDLGELSAKGSVVFHDAVSANYVNQGIVVGGAPFVGGSDEYGRLWAEHAGFTKTYARDFTSISVDRRRRQLRVDENVPEATPKAVRGKSVVLFVEAEMV